MLVPPGKGSAAVDCMRVYNVFDQMSRVLAVSGKNSSPLSY